MFNAAYLSQSLPYPFLSLFGDVCSIPIQDDEEDEEDEENEENEESVAE